MLFGALPAVFDRDVHRPPHRRALPRGLPADHHARLGDVEALRPTVQHREALLGGRLGVAADALDDLVPLLETRQIPDDFVELCLRDVALEQVAVVEDLPVEQLVAEGLEEGAQLVVQAVEVGAREAGVVLADAEDVEVVGLLPGDDGAVLGDLELVSSRS